jgi:hypothetical protein
MQLNIKKAPLISLGQAESDNNYQTITLTKETLWVPDYKNAKLTFGIF